jgi:hypothetical protein
MSQKDFDGMVAKGRDKIERSAERAEDRLGDMMENGKADRAQRGKPKGSQAGLFSPPSLKDLGIDSKLADRARKVHAMPRKEFEGGEGWSRPRLGG